MTSSIKQRRESTRAIVTFVAGTCETGPIDVREFNSMLVMTPAAWTPAAIGVKIAPVYDTTYKPLFQQVPCSLVSVGVQCYSVAVNQVHLLPNLGASGWCRLWSNDGAGGDVDQVATRKLDVVLKG